MRTRLKSRNESDLTARVLCTSVSTSVSLRRNVVRKVTCRKIDESASVCGGHYDDNAPSGAGSAAVAGADCLQERAMENR